MVSTCRSALLAAMVSAIPSAAVAVDAPDGGDFRQRLRFLLAIDARGEAALESRARSGDRDAMGLLGEAYGFAFGGLPQSDAKAAAWLSGAGNAGLAWAIREGDFFQFRSTHAAAVNAAAAALQRAKVALEGKPGTSEAPDPELEELAMSGVTDAQVALAEEFRSGKGAPLDPAIAATLDVAAARAGDPDAMLALARAYLAGNGVSRDPGSAAELLRAAAAAGSAPAREALGALLVHGAEGVTADPAEGMKWLALAASTGDGTAREAFTTLAPVMGPGIVAEALRRASGS
jgi:TPR repeat protein